MANDRDFSDSIKLEVIKDNLRRYEGSICCEICHVKLISIEECHFDHIVPWAKGGRSVKDNCQILCTNCNLSKSDKELKEFAMEEKAKAFLKGGRLETSKPKSVDEFKVDDSGKMTKEKFDEAIQRFIDEKGDIHQIDFNRAYNHLPGIAYMIKYYGTLNNMKTAFGIADISSNWNRETIKAALTSFVNKNGKITQKDIRKENGLPSINCILNYYPEYKNFTDVKRHLCNLKVPEKWTKESVLEAGKKFAEEHDGKLTQEDCKAENGLPATSTIYRFFGDIVSFQIEIGAKVSSNVYVPKEKIEQAVEEYFGEKDKVVESRSLFLKMFPYGADAISSRYGSFNTFLEECGITVLKTKKFKYSKQEVDDAVANYVKSGKPIPSSHDLSKLGLPSANVIMRYYEHWQEPFEMYKRIFNEADRTK